MSSSKEPSDRERIDKQLADQSDTLTERDLQAVRRALRDEQSRSGVDVSRRQALAAIAGGVGVGVLGGAGGMEATGSAAASSGSTTGDLNHVRDLTVEDGATIKGGASVKGGFDTDELYTGNGAQKTLYVDANATGTGDGSSWTDAFTTIQKAVDSLPSILSDTWEITVRANGPYQEKVNLHNIQRATHGGLIIEGEYWESGDCANNSTAGVVKVSNGAFANAKVGDQVFLINETGSNGKAVDYDLTTVQSVDSNNQITTGSSKTPTTGWRYSITRTEISGGGSRDNCIFDRGTGCEINGLQLTNSTDDAMTVRENVAVTTHAIHISSASRGLKAYDGGIVDFEDSYASVSSRYPLSAHRGGAYISALNAAFGVSGGGNHAANISQMGHMILNKFYLFNANRGVDVDSFGFCRAYRGTIDSNVSTGLFANYNGAIETAYLTNNATTTTNTANGGVIN